MTATAGPGSATVNWTAPANGGATSYTMTPYIGSTAQTPTTVTGSPPATSTTITGLTAGTAYTFTVQAVQRERLRPGVLAVERRHADRVRRARRADQRGGEPGSKQAQVSWTAPTRTAAPITGYTVTPFVGVKRADAGPGLERLGHVRRSSPA